jgi:hypothetical protein
LALTRRFTFEQFHSDVLQFFVPRRIFDNLKQDLYGRLQREKESFQAYASSIRDAATVLRLPVSDQELIDNILDGLSPLQRSRLAFQKRPSSWAEVDRLCIHDQNIFFADSVRPTEAPLNRAGTSQFASSPNAQASRPRANLVCFYCKKPGHIRRDYFEWRRFSGSNQEPSIQAPLSS